MSALTHFLATYRAKRRHVAQNVPERRDCAFSSLRDTHYFDSLATRFRNMPGIVRFKSVAEALRAGYQVYDKTKDGYLVRTRTAAGWAMAIVECKPSSSIVE